MKHDDAKILQEIQRNTEMGMTAIETILDKIEDDDFRCSCPNSRCVIRRSIIRRWIRFWKTKGKCIMAARSRI